MEVAAAEAAAGAAIAALDYSGTHPISRAVHLPMAHVSGGPGGSSCPLASLTPSPTVGARIGCSEPVAFDAAGGILSFVASNKSAEQSFDELVGHVEALAKGPTRRAATAAPRNGVVVRERARAREFQIEKDDEFVVGYALGVPARRAHDLGRGPEPVHQTVDLHGMSAIDARRALGLAVEGAARTRIRHLLVIHGKGTHSGRGGPVLRDVVLTELTGPLGSQVEAFHTAPRSHGGSGALLVQLRRRRADA